MFKTFCVFDSLQLSIVIIVQQMFKSNLVLLMTFKALILHSFSDGDSCSNSAIIFGISGLQGEPLSHKNTTARSSKRLQLRHFLVLRTHSDPPHSHTGWGRGGGKVSCPRTQRLFLKAEVPRSDLIFVHARAAVSKPYLLLI